MADPNGFFQRIPSRIRLFILERKISKLRSSANSYLKNEKEYWEDTLTKFNSDNHIVRMVHTDYSHIVEAIAEISKDFDVENNYQKLKQKYRKYPKVQLFVAQSYITFLECLHFLGSVSGSDLSVLPEEDEDRHLDRNAKVVRTKQDIREYFNYHTGFFGKKEKSPFKTPQSPTHTGGVKSFDEAHNNFAIAIYNGLRQPSANLVFSPFSIRAALAMMYAGARGETAAQMRAALRFAAGDEDLHTGFAEITGRLNEAASDSQEITVANSLWFQDGAPLRNKFFILVASHYRAGMNFVDFCSDAEAVRATINRWVEEQTKEKIRDLIPSGGVDRGTGMVLVNAIYFKGKWRLPFSEDKTREEPFYLEGGSTIQAHLMHREQTVSYNHSDGFQMIELDYKDSDLSMLVLLPDKKDGLGDLEKRLSAHLLRECLKKATEHQVDIFLPRFKVLWGTVDVGPQLSALGMPIAFNPKEADFSGINGYKPLEKYAHFISKVFHQALVEVNEKGTEAAAATAMSTLYGSLNPVRRPTAVFRADRPFLFAIRDWKSNAIVFLGRVVDPTRES